MSLVWQQQKSDKILKRSTLPSKYVCVFCYKCTEGDSNSVDKGNTLVLKRFLKLIERFVSYGISKPRLSSKWGIASKVGCCPDCGVLLETFCSKYHELRVLEMQLEWKVGNLIKIMKLANRVPSRVQQVRKLFEQKQFDSHVDEEEDNRSESRGISQKADRIPERIHIRGSKLNTLKTFRTEFVRQCSGRLAKSQPRVMVKRRRCSCVSPSPVPSLCQDNCTISSSSLSLALASMELFLGWLVSFAAVSGLISLSNGNIPSTSSKVLKVEPATPSLVTPDEIGLDEDGRLPETSFEPVSADDAPFPIIASTYTMLKPNATKNEEGESRTTLTREIGTESDVECETRDDIPQEIEQVDIKNEIPLQKLPDAADNDFEENSECPERIEIVPFCDEPVVENIDPLSPDSIPVDDEIDVRDVTDTPAPFTEAAVEDLGAFPAVSKRRRRRKNRKRPYPDILHIGKHTSDSEGSEYQLGESEGNSSEESDVSIVTFNGDDLLSNKNVKEDDPSGGVTTLKNSQDNLKVEEAEKNTGVESGMLGKYLFCHLDGCNFKLRYDSPINKQQFEEHQQLHETGSFYCSYCGAMETNLIKLSMHERIAHPDV